jgi:hypothetical protein
LAFSSSAARRGLLFLPEHLSEGAATRPCLLPPRYNAIPSRNSDHSAKMCHRVSTPDVCIPDSQCKPQCRHIRHHFKPLFAEQEYFSSKLCAHAVMQCAPTVPLPSSSKSLKISSMFNLKSRSSALSQPAFTSSSADGCSKGGEKMSAQLFY